MATLSESVQTHTTLTSFASHAAVYSHGLEAIYALETVDVKSIRKFSSIQSKILKPALASFPDEYEEKQLSFDLGNAFRGWMRPYIGKEPLQVLSLGKHIEKSLLDKHLYLISDLLALNVDDMAALRGLGQGHIEDIKSTLNSYLVGKPREKTTVIDFLSLLKGIFGDLDRRKAFIFLEPYSLAEWISLTPMEKKDVQRLNEETVHGWKQEIAGLLQRGDKRLFLEEQFQVLVDTWLKPWIAARGYFASSQALDEALILRSLDESIATKSLALFRTYLSYENMLPTFEKIVTVNEGYLQRLKKICNMALTYFPTRKNVYQLDQLCLFIHAECLRQWDNIMPHEIEQVLRLYTKFHVFRGEKGEWNITPRIKARYFNSSAL